MGTFLATKLRQAAVAIVGINVPDAKGPCGFRNHPALVIYTRCGERVPADEEFPEKLRGVIKQKGGFSQVAVLYIEGEFFNAASKSGPESNFPQKPNFPEKMSYIDPSRRESVLAENVLSGHPALSGFSSRRGARFTG